MNITSNFRKSFFATSVIITLLFCNSSFAAPYGVIDTKRIMNEAKAVIYTQKVINKKQLEFKEIVTNKEGKLKQEEDSLIAKKDLLSAEGFKQEEEKLQKKIDDFKDFVIEKNNILQEALQDAIKIIEEKIKESITEIAQQKKYSIIFPEGSLVYYEENLDITNDVLNLVNSKIEVVDIKFSNKKNK